MPRVIPTPATVRRAAALLSLCVSVSASLPDYGLLLAAIFTIPIALLVAWLTGQIFKALSRAWVPNVSKSPFQPEESILMVATVVPIVVELGYCIFASFEVLRPWRWVVLALVTAWWFPSASPLRGAVRRAAVALVGGFGAAAHIALTLYMDSFKGPYPTPTLQEWTLWVLTIVWLWFGATQAWWAVVLLIRKSEASTPKAGDDPVSDAGAS